eukprot:3284877-Rhodomonas_salina.1
MVPNQKNDVFLLSSLLSLSSPSSSPLPSTSALHPPLLPPLSSPLAPILSCPFSLAAFALSRAWTCSGEEPVWCSCYPGLPPC